MSTKNRETLLDCVAAALAEAGFGPPLCEARLERVAEKRLPMGRVERVSGVCVKYWPRPAVETVGFEGPEEEEPADYRLPALTRRLELIDTPDGPVRGRHIECAVKNGAAAVSAVYTEILRESPPPGPAMAKTELNFTFEGSN